MPAAPAHHGLPAAVTFCPHPPLLVPQVGAGEPVAVRTPAVGAMRWLLGQGIQQVLVLGSTDGPDEPSRAYRPGASGNFAGFGVPFEVALPGDPAPEGGDEPLPLSLAVGAWLLGAAGCRLTASGLAIGRDEPASDELAATGLLVMGDGSARRSEKAPGWLDPRAEPLDAAIASALAAGNPAGLHLDPGLAADLLVAGAPVWRFVARHLAGSRWRAELCYADAPYGVGYFVATWQRP